MGVRDDRRDSKQPNSFAVLFVYRARASLFDKNISTATAVSRSSFYRDSLSYYID